MQRPADAGEYKNDMFISSDYRSAVFQYNLCNMDWCVVAVVKSEAMEESKRRVKSQ